MSLTHVRNLKKWIKKIIPGDYDYHIEVESIIDVFNIAIDNDMFSNLNKNKLQIIDFSDEPWLGHTFIEAEGACRAAGLKKYLILSRDLQYYKNPSWPNILYFPHNYYDPLIHWKLHEGLDQSTVVNRKYFFSCLNRIPREHRIYNYYKLQAKSYYLNNSLLTLHNIDTTLYGDNPINAFSPDITKYWNRISDKLPSHCTNDLNFTNDAYSNAYINLVTETSMSLGEHFFTEKVYKPLACGQFFILLSTPGSVEVLRSMGFDTYDDIIDHSRYDNIVDWRERIDAAHQLLDELYFLDWDKIYKDTLHRRQRNIKLFFSGDPVRPFGEELAKTMSRIDGKPYIYNDSKIVTTSKFNKIINFFKK